MCIRIYINTYAQFKIYFLLTKKGGVKYEKNKNLTKEVVLYKNKK